MPNDAITISANTDLTIRINNVKAYCERALNDTAYINKVFLHHIDDDGTEDTDYAALATLLGTDNVTARTIYNTFNSAYQAMNVSAVSDIVHRIT